MYLQNEEKLSWGIWIAPFIRLRLCFDACQNDGRLKRFDVIVGMNFKTMAISLLVPQCCEENNTTLDF